jgi:prepilin-type N-terminal cleavage/methylation domain-containing protein
MQLPRPKRTARTGFTLIELLVVIAIIAVLVSLTAAGIFKIVAKGPALQNSTTLRQLESSVAEFHRSIGLDKEYFPSRLILCENYGDYFSSPGVPVSQLHGDSIAFLQRMFPKLWKYNTNPIDWNGNGTAGDPAVTLEGDQCLVFFLGGIPLPASSGGPGVQGFSRVTTNPAFPASPGVDRKGPFFEFESARLKDLKGNGFYSYIDVYESKPYLYFSSYKRRNNYNPYGSSDCPTAEGPPGGPYVPVWPYAESFNPSTGITQYLYPGKFQIISAGADKHFGVGTDLSIPIPANRYYWTLGTRQAIPSFDPVKFPDAGIDDQANFNDGGLLGEGD